MHWITTIWSMATAGCLMIAGIHFLVWRRTRAARANLALVITSLGVAGTAALELGAMHAGTPSEYLTLLRWSNVPVLGFIFGLVFFFQSDFRTGRRWLAILAVGLRALLLVAGFFPGPSIQFARVETLKEVLLLGEWVTVVDQAVPSRFAILAILANLLALAFSVDATVRLARRGDATSRTRAIWVGGSMCLFLLFASGTAMLINARVLRMPYANSLAALGIVGVMAHRLSRDITRAQRLAQDLGESERRLHLALEAASLGLWSIELSSRRIWATDRAKAMFGYPPETVVTVESFLGYLHPDDRARVEARMEQAVTDLDGYSADYRILRPDGQERWIAAHGEVVCDAEGQPMSMTGVIVDITERHRAELELNDQRTQLAHLARATTVAELSGSLAHELNQPLAIILSNAQAAQRLLAQTPPDIAEAREILADIVREDQRAGEVIRRLRRMLRNEQVDLRPVSVGDLVGEVLHLLRRDLDNNGVRVDLDVPPDLPQVRGDPVQLQQVLLNLILNASEAMEIAPADRRSIEISARCTDGCVRISIADTGAGPPLDVERAFEPFYTTKADGLGLGLPICRSIVAAHRGRLWGEVRPPVEPGQPHGGSILHIELEALSQD